VAGAISSSPPSAPASTLVDGVGVEVAALLAVLAISESDAEVIGSLEAICAPPLLLTVTPGAT